MTSIRLPVWGSRREHVAEFAWDDGGGALSFRAYDEASPAFRAESEAILKTGLWEEDGGVTPTADRRFLPRLADFVQRSHPGYRSQLWELPGDGTIRRGAEVPR